MTEASSADLWALYGSVDVAAALAPDTLEKRDDGRLRFTLDLSTGTDDGVLEMRSATANWRRPGEWWSASEPSLFDFRASIRAADGLRAVVRGRGFVEYA